MKEIKMKDMRLSELFNKSDAKSLNEFISTLTEDILDKYSYTFKKTHHIDKFKKEVRDQVKELRKRGETHSRNINAYVSHDLTHLYLLLRIKDAGPIDDEGNTQGNGVSIITEEENPETDVIALRMRISIERMRREGLCSIIKEHPEDKWDPFGNDTYKVKGSLINDGHWLSSDGGDKIEISWPYLAKKIVAFNHKQKEEYDDGFTIVSNNVIESILKSKSPKN